jgi:hypothetical protein
MLALRKEPWRFKDLEEKLNMYRQQCQADQQRHIISKMAVQMPGKSNDGKRKNNEINNHNSNGGRSSGHHGNNGQGGRVRCLGGRSLRGSNNSEH